MKLSKADKLKIYELKKSGKTVIELSHQFQVNETIIKYLIRLLDVRGVGILDKTGHRHYSTELKLEMIKQVLEYGCSEWQTAIDYGLPGRSSLSKWITEYKKNGYTIVEETKGRVKLMTKTVKQPRTEIEKLQEENLKLKAEVAV